MVNEHSVYNGTIPSGLISILHALIFLQAFKGLSLSKKICLIVSQICISHHGWGKFSNLCCLKCWKNAFASQKVESNICIYVAPTPRQKSPPGSYHHPPGREKLLIFTGRDFIPVNVRSLNSYVYTER